MAAIPSHVSNANQLQVIWRQRRQNAALAWKDAQWSKFDRVCNEEIQSIIKRNADATQKLDSELSRALSILDSV